MLVKRRPFAPAARLLSDFDSSGRTYFKELKTHNFKINIMTQSHNSTSQANTPSLVKLALFGALIGLAVISLFIFPVNSNPAWGKLWMIRPLIIVPLAGATGGACRYFLVNYHNTIGLNKTIASILSLVVFAVGLWMGVILGLDGTLWD